MNGVAVLITPLVATTLVLLTAVAALPALLLASRPPQPPATIRGPLAGASLQLVRGGQGTWFIDGQPIAAEGLARLLRQQRGGISELRFQPSARLAAGSVSSSMAWLRQQSGRPVVLQLASGSSSAP